MATRMTPREMMAPPTLGLETRDAVRKAALKELEAMPEGSGRLIIDLAKTAHVDSAGLGALMLIQRRAAERRQAVTLRNVRQELQFLLMLTKLDELFDIDAPEKSGNKA